MRTEPEAFAATFYEFSEDPGSDSCWSLSTGPDGRIYASSCNEISPGQSAKVVRYNEDNDALDYLFDVAEAADDPTDSGRGTQCKIHYSFAPSPADGILYCATHLSGPPYDLPAYSPWRFWHDEKRCFRGAALIAYDTQRDAVLWHDTLIPKEGCRCLVLDDETRTLYALGYPRDHFIAYSLESRTRRDIGRLGSVNSQALFLDRRRRVWTVDDYGHMIRYDLERDALEQSPYVLPHESFQSGWHSVIYDAVASPDGECVYITTWNVAPRLLRFWPEQGDFGRIEDLGMATQQRDTSIPYNMFMDHAGGLVFGNDGMLYFVRSRWFDESEQATPADRQFRAEGVLVQLDPVTLEQTEVAVLKRPDAIAQYISRAARDRNGDLFFANVGKIPVGFFRVTGPDRRPNGDCHAPLRMWG